MSATRAAVTVRTVRTAGGVRAVFHAARDDVPDLTLLLAGEDVLRSARENLDSSLRELKDATRLLTVRDERAEEVYLRLRAIGLKQMFMVFSSTSVFVELHRFLRSALPEQGSPALIQCIGDLGAMLPIEYFPVLGGPADVRDRESLITACRTFLGFSCIVRRTFVNLPLPQDTELRPRGGRLPMRFLRHDALPGADAEWAWFTRTAAAHVVAEGPYPSGNDHGLGLPEQICDPRTGRPGLTPDEIQHFACHCYATSDKPLANEIELSGGGHTVRVRLEELVEAAADHHSRGRDRVRMPLVVMNACGSSRMSSAGAMSFPWFFLKNDNRGFVGSDIEVPDAVAAAFSAAFYTSLIIERRPLGEALHRARQHLLTRYGNPLGLCYSAYADPDLRVTSPGTAASRR